MNVYQKNIKLLNGSILLGCDGFVDDVYEIVDVRSSPTEFSAIDHLKDLGELLVKRGDGGVGLEIVHKRRCEGGFAINTGRVGGMLGLKPTLLGLFGDKELDPAFSVFSDICELISLGDPALTLAFEFSDGKVLMSDMKTVSQLTWSQVVAKMDPDELSQVFSDVDILGLGYWSLTPDFDNLLKGFVSQTHESNPPRRMFFDFADIQKKSEASFAESLRLLGDMDHTIPMTLSVNEHEILEVFRRLEMEEPEDRPDAIASHLKIAREKIGIDELVVHTPVFAAASQLEGGEAFALQETQTDVIRTAGAGDTFNGGYLCASLGPFSVKERLVIANAATAFFVCNAIPPTPEQLMKQIEKASDR